MYPYYFLENGEVMFIELFSGAEEAIEHKNKYFPKATLTVQVKEQD